MMTEVAPWNDGEEYLDGGWAGQLLFIDLE